VAYSLPLLSLVSEQDFLPPTSPRLQQSLCCAGAPHINNSTMQAHTCRTHESLVNLHRVSHLYCIDSCCCCCCLCLQRATCIYPAASCCHCSHS
jgi:hypothetical protein